MSMGLHNLQRFPRSVRRRKRIGRGLGSGHGAFSTRGVKGQRARSGGVAGIGRRSLKSLIAHLPKFKGMKRAIPKLRIVSTDQLERHFPAGAQVSGSALVAAGLIDRAAYGVKVLTGVGKLSKPLTVTANGFSAKAKKMIEDAGGKAIVKKS